MLTAAVVTVLSVLFAVTVPAPGPVLAGAFVAAGAGPGWTLQVSGTTSDLFDVCFADRYCGWAVGDGVILATTDGGKTWTRQAVDQEVGQLRAVSCTDRNHCWAAGYDGVFATTDGGKTWSRQSTDFIGGDDVCFVDNLHGWVAGYGSCCTTTDGGLSWTTTELPYLETDEADYLPFMFGASFADASRGWAVGAWRLASGGGGGPAIIATRDGGLTWEIQEPPEGMGEFYGVDFVDADYGWAVGFNGIAATTDGGATWNEQDPGTLAALRDVSFVDRQRGWAVGWGTIVYTADGGRTWTVQKVLPTAAYDADFKGVHFVDAEHGWAVGSGGTILCYSPEGEAGPAFTDLEGYDWAREAIESLAAQGIIKGVGEGRFDPGGTITREQFAALVERLFKLPQPAQPVSCFDLPPGHWAYGSVQAVSPYMPPLGPGRFGVGEPCDRETAASVLVRVLYSL